MKSLLEEMGGTYRREGDYLILNLILPAQKEMQPLGKYGRIRLYYLKEHRRVLYTDLLMIIGVSAIKRNKFSVSFNTAYQKW